MSHSNPAELPNIRFRHARIDAMNPIQLEKLRAVAKDNIVVVTEQMHTRNNHLRNTFPDNEASHLKFGHEIVVAPHADGSIVYTGVPPMYPTKEGVSLTYVRDMADALDLAHQLRSLVALHDGTNMDVIVVDTPNSRLWADLVLAMYAPEAGLVKPEGLSLSAIVACDLDFAIGKAGDLPWRHRGDLKHFKDTTVGHVLIMGRKTFESLPKVLPNRTHIVVSSKPRTNVPDGVIWVQSMQDALDRAALECANSNRKAFVVGGAMVYGALYDLIDEWIISNICVRVEDADAHISMPDNRWLPAGIEHYPPGKVHAEDVAMSIVRYKRAPSGD